jgi:hypothetical protein
MLTTFFLLSTAEVDGDGNRDTGNNVIGRVPGPEEKGKRLQRW